MRLFEWEKQLESLFLKEIQGLRLDVGFEDSWVWKDGELLRYLVNSAYVFLRKDSEGEHKYLYDKFWRCKSLSSAQVIA